jgi:hypothetical protein
MAVSIKMLHVVDDVLGTFGLKGYAGTLSLGPSTTSPDGDAMGDQDMVAGRNKQNPNKTKEKSPCRLALVRLQEDGQRSAKGRSHVTCQKQ